MELKGYVKLADYREKKEFFFTVPNGATDEDIEREGLAALWESGFVEWWWER